MAWNEAVVTSLGLALLAESVTEGGIVIRKAVGGENCCEPVSMLAQSRIAEPVHQLQVAKLERNGNVITVNVRIQNTGLEKPYMLRQIGLFAGLEADEEQQVLFALIQDEKGEEIPSEAENPEFLVEFDFVIPVSNAERISIDITPNTFATVNDVNSVLEAEQKHEADKTLHITSTERQSWNSKAEGTHKHTKSEITDLSDMTAATASAAGKEGLVPAPAAGKQTSFLRGDGTWAVPTNTNTAKASSTATVGSASGWSAGSLPTLGTAIAADDITAWSAGTLPTLGTAIPADDITAWSAGSLPTLGTAIAADDITAWSAGTAASAAVSKGVLTITNGTAPSLTYTARSIPNVTGVGTLPSLTYAAKSIPNVTGVGSLPSLSYTARSIPNVTAVGTLPSLKVTNITVVTGVST